MKIDNRLIDAKSESENTENFNRIMSLLDKANLQPDWNQNDETAANYVKNRPFYSESTLHKITWDGDTTGRAQVASLYYKVGDSMPTGDGVSEFICYMKNGETELQETITGISKPSDGYGMISDYAIICYDTSKKFKI